MEVIALEFDKTLIGVAGNGLGQETFEKQVKDKIDYQQMVEIIIPNHIIMVGLSFVQGFTVEIFRHIEKKDFEKYFIIKGDRQAVVEFNEGLYI